MIPKRFCQYGFLTLWLLQHCFNTVRGEVIDLSSQVRGFVPDFFDSRISIEMCWGEIIIERTDDTQASMFVETNIWEKLNVNGGVVSITSFNELELTFTKASDIEELNLEEDIYVRATLNIPSNHIIETIRTKGSFDFYLDSSFPSPTGSVNRKSGDPPTTPRTKSRYGYPEGARCPDFMSFMSDYFFVIPIVAFVMFAVCGIFIGVMARRRRSGGAGIVITSRPIAANGGELSNTTTTTATATPAFSSSLPTNFSTNDGIPTAPAVSSGVYSGMAIYDDDKNVI